MEGNRWKLAAILLALSNEVVFGALLTAQRQKNIVQTVIVYQLSI